jgi:hypothetical protein
MNSPEENLYNYLFVNNTYNKKIPPIINETHRNLTIDIELELMGVMNVD